MPLDLEAKKTLVETVNAAAKSAVSVGVAEYRGLTVAEMTTLRNAARSADVSVRVVKNTLARRAFEKTPCACIDAVLSGPVLLGFSENEPGAVARVFHEFSKDADALVVKGLCVGGEFVAADALEKIAKLPSKNQAVAMLARVLRAPVEKLARTLSEIPARPARVLAAVRDKKQSSEQ